MKIRHGLLLIGALALAGCSWIPHFGKDKTPKQATLMKSLTGEVDYDLVHALPADAYLDVTLADVSKQDAPARVIATDHIAPIGVSPVSFVLSYEPGDLGDGVDFAVSARNQAGGSYLGDQRYAGARAGAFRQRRPGARGDFRNSLKRVFLLAASTWNDRSLGAALILLVSSSSSRRDSRFRRNHGEVMAIATTPKLCQRWPAAGMKPASTFTGQTPAVARAHPR